MDRKVIALDLGGTYIKYGVVDDIGKILVKAKRPTIEDKNNNLAIVESASKAINEMLEKYPDVEAICISTAGLIDNKSGLMNNATGDFMKLIGLNIIKYFEDKFKLTTLVENDANCAAIAEKWQGSAKEYKDFILITVGTGIGGGIYINDKLFKGANGLGGEIGHFIINYDGIKCTCGGKGCFERYASTKALIQQVEASINKHLTGEEIFKLYKAGDTEIINIVKQWISYLANGISSLLHILNPEAIIIGGGISAEEELIKELRTKVREITIKSYTDNLVINSAKTGNNAGILGAAYLYFQDI